MLDIYNLFMESFTDNRLKVISSSQSALTTCQDICVPSTTATIATKFYVSMLEPNKSNDGSLTSLLAPDKEAHALAVL